MHTDKFDGQRIVSQGSITFDQIGVRPEAAGTEKYYVGHGSSCYFSEACCEGPSFLLFTLEVLQCVVDGHRISFIMRREDGHTWDFSGVWKNGKTFSGRGTLRGGDNVDDSRQMTFHKQ